MHIAILTAGGAGMFCGSCMHDNTWARSLMDAGATVSLLPTYTPIRVDEQDQSASKVYLGGINMYLEHRVPLLRRLPRWILRWLDSRWILSLASKLGVSNDADELGELALAMLAGEAGPQGRQIDELSQALAEIIRPDVIVFSNALLVGSLRKIKERFNGPVHCLLQGDDIFLEGLREPYRTEAMRVVAERSQQFDGFLTHSEYYRDFMSDYLQLPREKFARVPLGIDFAGHDGQPRRRDAAKFTVGFFARICPEKGLHQLLEGFRLFHARHPDSQLLAGGYLGPRDAKYFQELRQSATPLGDAFRYLGSPDTHAEKVAFIKRLDVLSVPTVYHEPKGLPVLEALANGVPVVQPAHGSFPEMVSRTAGGLLVTPGDPEALAAALEELYHDEDQRLSLAHAGWQKVREHYSPEVMAQTTLDIFRR